VPILNIHPTHDGISHDRGDVDRLVDGMNSPSTRSGRTDAMIHAHGNLGRCGCE
jgi:hypothetical protein